MPKFKYLWIIIGLLITQNVFGKIKLPAIIGNNMVLQQQSNVPLWGVAKANTIVKIISSWNRKVYKIQSDATGHWKLKISTPVAGGPYEITFDDGSLLVLRNILIGEVWVCSGQSNMEISMMGYKNQPILNSNDILMKADNPNLHLFVVKRAVSNTPLDDCKGSWETSTPESASSFSAVGFQFAKMLQEILKVPVGIIQTTWGGTQIQAWMDKTSLASFPNAKIPMPGDTLKADGWRQPTCLFNGMISPIIGFGIKGFLWYQGENNVLNHPSDYDKLMQSMVQEWRILWQRDTLPFYYVQIAPYKYLTDRDSVPILQERQQKAQNEIPHSGMVVSIDKGNEFTVHPPDKTTISKRLLYWALGDTYQKKGIAYESPLYKDMKKEGNAINISFTNTSHGFTSHDQPINGFEIAGADRIFHPANATIYKNTIQVKSDEISDPIAVRYAFKDWVVGNLYNTEGLPIAPFRTDNW